MACISRTKYGSCSHYQCPFSKETNHGYECVEILIQNSISFCEVGEGCLKQCSYSWQTGDNSEVEQAANDWIRQMDESLKVWEEQQ